MILLPIIFLEDICTIGSPCNVSAQESEIQRINEKGRIACKIRTYMSVKRLFHPNPPAWFENLTYLPFLPSGGCRSRLCCGRFCSSSSISLYVGRGRSLAALAGALSGSEETADGSSGWRLVDRWRRKREKTNSPISRTMRPLLVGVLRRAERTISCDFPSILEIMD